MRLTIAPSLVVLLPCASLLSGCSESSAPSGTIGDMGYGTFTYLCVDEGDAVCNATAAVDASRVAQDLGVEGQLPALVAVAGRFNLQYSGAPVYTDEYYGLPVEIVPALPDAVRAVGGFSFREAGTVAFLVRNPQGVVVDFIHVSAVPADSLDLWWNAERVGSFSLEYPGLETEVAVVPVDEAGINLAGALPYVWSSSDPAVVRIEAVGSAGVPPPDTVVSDDEVRVVAMAEGQAELTVEYEGMVTAVNVTVGPEPTR